MADPSPDEVSHREPAEMPEPKALLWAGQDPALFQAICETLEQASVPFGHSQLANFETQLLVPFPVGPFDMAIHEVYVSEETLDRARHLIAGLRLDTAPRLCPLCKAGHFETFTECTDCGIGLVESPFEVWKNPPVILWCGDRRSDLEWLFPKLTEAGIRHLLFEFETRRIEPRAWLVIVRRSDLGAAFQFLKERLETVYPQIKAVAGLPGYLSERSLVFCNEEGIGVDVWTGENLPDDTSPAALFEAHEIPHAVVKGCYWFVPPAYEGTAQELINQIPRA